MKAFAYLCTVALFLLMAATVTIHAQDRQDERNGAKTAQPQDPTRPQEDRQQEQRGRDQSAPDQRSARPEQQRQDETRQQPDRNRQPEPRPETARPDEQRREPAQTNRNEQRPAEHERGRRIDDQRFRSEFGPQHRFHVRRSDIENRRQPVFAYGGYTFQLAEPWPVEWSYDDDCYIDYTDDDYYLYDPMHPGMRVALIIIGG
jgi:hypothetical protein